MEMKKVISTMKTNLFLFFVTIFCACGGNFINVPTNVSSVLVIDLLSEPISEVNKLSDIASDIEYIPLQTSASSLMGSNIRKIVHTNKRFYINSHDEILCFDIDGKFLNKIDNRGRGPEEYTFLWDFDVSSNGKLLTILSSSKLLIYVITETGFLFQRSIQFKDPVPYKARIVPETEYVFLAIPPWRGTEMTLSLLINTFGDTINFKPNGYKYKMIKQKGQGLDEMQVYSIENKVCFKEEFSDTVYFIDTKDNFLKPWMILNSHGTIITPEIRGGSEAPGKVRISTNNIFETTRYVFYLSYIKDNQNRVLENRILFDKKTNSKFRLKIESGNSKLKDDLSGGPDFNMDYFKFYCSEGKLFSIVEALTLKDYVASENFKNTKLMYPEKKEELRKLADSLKETDNPVLVMVTPKE